MDNLNEDQCKGVEICDKKHNLYILGYAGCGKTYLLRYIYCFLIFLGAGSAAL